MNRRPYYVWMALLMILAVIFACANHDAEIRAYLEKASKFMEDDQNDSALVVLEQALALDEKHVNANVEYQDLLRYTMNRDEEVLAKYRKNAEENPRIAVWQFLYARLKNEPDLTEARHIAAMAPRKSWAQFHLGYTYYREGYDDEAIAALDRAIDYDPENSMAYTYKAIVHQNTGEIDKAIETYRKLKEIDPDYVYADISIWRLQYTNAEDKEAEKERILGEIEDNAESLEDPRFLSSLRYLYNTLDEPEKAKATEDKLLAMDTDGTYAQSIEYTKIYQLPSDAAKLKAAEAFLKKYDKGVYRGIVYGLLFRSASAIPGYSKEKLVKIEEDWLNLDDRNNSAYYTLANYYMNTAKDYNKTIKLCEEGIEKSRRVYDRYLYDMMGCSYVKTGQPEKGLEALMKADSLYGDINPAVHHHMGEAYLAMGKTDKAMDCLVNSLGLIENDEARKLYYAAFSKKNGTKKGAEEALNSAILKAAAVEEPYPAPDFTLVSLNDEEITFSDHIGKILVVQFWKPG